jgi:predicted DCC family thiol-disulfide oxidoreductase YuxK
MNHTLYRLTYRRNQSTATQGPLLSARLLAAPAWDRPPHETLLYHMPPAPPVLLYDGDCALCSRAVRTALRWDRRGTLQFAALHGPAATALLARAPVEVRTADSLIWVEPGASPQYRIRSDAVLALAHYLGGWATVAQLARLLPHDWRDLGYTAIARRRMQWLGPSRSCVLPPPHDRPRFLDLR